MESFVYRRLYQHTSRLESLIRADESASARMNLGRYLLCVGVFHSCLGEWDQADQRFTASYNILSQQYKSRPAGEALLWRMTVSFWRGDWHALCTRLKEDLEYAKENQLSLLHMYSSFLRILILALQNRVKKARAAWEELQRFNSELGSQELKMIARLLCDIPVNLAFALREDSRDNVLPYVEAALAFVEFRCPIN